MTMSDLKQRLDAVEHLPVDDLWPEIRERYEDKAAGKVTSLRIAEKRRGPEVGWRKGLTIAAVFVLLAAVGIVLVRSLTSETIPANPPDEPAPPPLSGPLAYWDMQAGQVYVADLDGSNAVAIADVGAIDDECPGDVHTVAPSWSPDGRYLAFRRSSGCSARDDVVIADLQGNVVGAFSTQKKYSPYEIGWSPDSTRVAVWDEYRWRQSTYTIGVYAIDGTLEAAIEMPSGWEPSWPAHPIIWTPDDASLIVSQLEVPLDGGTPREIPFHGAFSDRFGG